MKITVLCPAYPPETNGVGDYTFQLCRSFVLSGDSIQVITCVDQPSGQAGVELARVSSAKTFKGVREILGELKRFKPQALLIQYAPRLFSPGALRPLVHLEWLLLRAKQLSIPTALMAHELHYPVELDPRGIIHGIPQFMRFVAMAHLTEQVYFSYECARDEWLKRLPYCKEKFAWFPVGSNIDRAPSSDVRGPLGIDKEDLVFLHFGGAHPTHLIAHKLECLRQVKDAVLVMIGVTRDELSAYSYSDVEARVRILGRLSSREVSQWFQAADLLLSPLMDGMTTRRSSVMSALSHGIPVATNRSYLTGPSTPWKDFMAISDSSDCEDYVQMVVELVKDRDTLSVLGKKGEDYFNTNFAWAKTRDRMKKKLSEIAQ